VAKPREKSSMGKSICPTGSDGMVGRTKSGKTTLRGLRGLEKRGEADQAGDKGLHKLKQQKKPTEAAHESHPLKKLPGVFDEWSCAVWGRQKKRILGRPLTRLAESGDIDFKKTCIKKVMALGLLPVKG